jgi:signal transduction histidine kinase
MRLATRMWLLGALVPTLAALLALLVAGGWFRRHLEAALDRALLAQAAVESVSLFDGPGGRVHLHMASSPLVDSVRPFAPTGDLFGPDGSLVMSYPPRLPGAATDVPHRPAQPLQPGQPPRLSTHTESDGARFRELVVAVAAPASASPGGLYTLRLAASLDQLDRSTRVFYQTTLSLVALFGALLLALQAVQARRLGARLRGIGAHMTALREGNLDQELAPDSTRDEVGELRAVIAEATAKLSAARQGQERFLADAAHELRTPLGLMRTSLDLALRRPRSPEELRATLQEVRSEVVRLGALCQRLLDRSALAQADWDRRAADLRALVAEAAMAARAQAEERGLLIEIEGPDALAIRGHAPSLRQALDNLLSNALRFAPQGTRIVVQLARAGTNASVAVWDEGPGVPPELRPHLFSPFHRGAPRAKEAGEPVEPVGHGLGLSIAREIATRHGGRLYLDEQAPRGARFVLELPSG